MNNAKYNPHISVDCVIFGFDDENLKVLLIDRQLNEKEKDLKLPGSLININEDLDLAAQRVLKELTGVKDIYLEQLHAFGSPQRIKNKKDLDWFSKTYNMPVQRVVTIAYYSLVKIDLSNSITDKNKTAAWYHVENMNELAFDHADILKYGLKTLRNEVRSSPIVFELLPKKFTIRQVQNLYEAILNEKLDNRNFRKKMEKLDYLVPLEEKETNVAHKPAQLFEFNINMESKYKYNKEYIM